MREGIVPKMGRQSVSLKHPLDSYHFNLYPDLRSSWNGIIFQPRRLNAVPRCPQRITHPQIFRSESQREKTDYHDKYNFKKTQLLHSPCKPNSNTSFLN